MSKQLCINRIPLCDDVLYIIKSFCFYDVQKLTIQKLKPIVDRFKTAVFSRFQPNTYYQSDSDNCEQWMTSLALISDNDNDRIYEVVIDENVFREANCCICGGYKSSKTHYLIRYYPKPKQVIPQNIKCHCV